MEKTIEERAEEYINSTEFMVSSIISPRISYIKGATEQREKDIEKAYNWIREHVRMVDYLPCFVSNTTYPMYGDEFANMFKAAMEEK